MQEAHDPQTAVAAAGVVPAAQPKSVAADTARSRAQVILVVIGWRAFFFGLFYKILYSQFYLIFYSLARKSFLFVILVFIMKNLQKVVFFSTNCINLFSLRFFSSCCKSILKEGGGVFSSRTIFYFLYNCQ